jgi:two-component system nitrate/nitrite response regulator NarL
MKHNIPTLVDAPDELSQAGVLGVLAGARYKPVVVKGGWEAVVASGKTVPNLVIFVLSGTIRNMEAVAKKIEAMAKLSKVIILSDCCEANLVRRALCAGGSAFLPRSIAGDTLIQTLNLAVDGEVVFPSQILGEVFTCSELSAEPKRTESLETITPSERPGRLSLREIDILKRLVQGDSNKQISRQLDISETTVKVHVKAILRKIRVRNRTQAAIWGLDNLGGMLGTNTHAAPAPSALHVPQASLASNGYPTAPVDNQRGRDDRGVARQ